MCKKLKASPESEPPLAAEAVTDPELKSEKKKSKRKEKLREEVVPSPEIENDSGHKRKNLSEAHTENGTESDSNKKKKKKKRGGEEANSLSDNVGGKNEEVRDGIVVVSGKDVKNPKYAVLETFEGSKLPANVLECCKGFKSPSPIQSRAWPFLLDGRDFIGIAATGSGKTLAFGIPAIMNVLNKRKGKMSRGRLPLCLVMSPTRELAQQIFDVSKQEKQRVLNPDVSMEESLKDLKNLL